MTENQGQGHCPSNTMYRQITRGLVTVQTLVQQVWVGPGILHFQPAPADAGAAGSRSTLLSSRRQTAGPHCFSERSSQSTCFQMIWRKGWSQAHGTRICTQVILALFIYAGADLVGFPQGRVEGDGGCFSKTREEASSGYQGQDTWL